MLGISGFATIGINCKAEAEAMHTLYRYLLRQRPPSLVIDGGVRGGVLGANGTLAARFGIPSLGYLPYKGLAEAGARSYFVVVEQTFRDREKYIGTTPDLLVCFGGGDGTRRECIAAIEQGSLAMVVAPQAYSEPTLFPNTYLNFPILSKALRTGRLVFCGPQDSLPAKLDELLVKLEAAKRASRPARLHKLNNWLVG